MNLSFDQSLYGFDLDFLHQEPSNDVQPHVSHTQNQIEQKTIAAENVNSVSQSDSIQLQKKSSAGRHYNYVKRKVINTNALILQYHTKVDEITQLQIENTEAKEKLRDACIERDKERANSDILRKNCEALLNKNQDLEKLVLENQHFKAALESHNHQLQELLKEYESQIEGLKLEKALTKSTVKDLEKSVLFLTKKRDEVTPQLHMMADVISSKRTMTREERLLVIKYMKQKKKIDAAKETDKVTPEKLVSDSDAGDCDGFLSDTEVGASEDSEKVVFSPPLPPKIQETKKTDPTKKDDAEVDQDLTCEVTSIDTGRGSSLAFSDSDTLYSPEYYLNSPASVFSVEDLKRKAKGTSVATSPIAWGNQQQEKATSPVTVTVDKTVKKVKCVDKSTSPIRITVQTDVDGIEALPTTSERTNREKRRHLDSENNTDGEVEMILNCMKLSGAPITPIPETPARSQGVTSRTAEKIDFLVAAVAKMSDAFHLLAKTNPDIKKTLPSPDSFKPFLKSHEQRFMANNRLEPDASCSTSRVIDSPEPDITFEDTSIADEEDCIILNQHKRLPKSSLSRSIQFENERGMEEFIRPKSPQILQPKTKLSEKIQFENERDEYPPKSITTHDDHDTGNLQDHDQCPSSANKDMKKISKAKKLTRLEKLRSNLIPKRKIRNATPTRQLRRKIKTPSTTQNKKTNNIISSATLNNKEVYEKAVRVMAELKSQQKTATPKLRTRKQNKSVKDMSGQEADTDKLTKEENSGNVTPVKQDEVSTNLANDDTLKHEFPNSSFATPKQNNSPRSVVTSPRRAESPETEKILFNIRKKYPSICLDKEIEVVIAPSPEIAEKLRWSDTDEKPLSEQRKITPRKLQFDTEQPNIVDSAKTPKRFGRKRVPNENLDNVGSRRILRSDTRRSLDAEKNNNESNTPDKNTGKASTTTSDKLDSPRSRRTSTNKLELSGCVSPKSTPTMTDNFDTCGRVTRKRSLLASSNENLSTLTTTSTNNLDNTSRITRKRSLEASSNENLVNYDDLDIFNETPSREHFEDCNDLLTKNTGPPPPPKKQKFLQFDTNFILQPQESILCKMIEAHGISKIKTFPKKVPEATVAAINTKLSESIDEIIKLPLKEAPDAMKKTVNELQKWKLKEFLAGLMAYLTDPTRRMELFNKLQFLSAPSMTKQEQVLLYFVTNAKWRNRDTADCVLTKIEHALFSLGKTPDLQVIESVSHFYAILCRWVQAKTRLRLFVLNAMYCLTYSAFALIKQCIEVWMHILPLAHMGIAKCPVVMTLVYLLHFYKSDDTKNKVQDMRNILKRKYFFHVTEWDETKILDMFKNSILELQKDDRDEDALRLALLILAKRNGVNWCQNKLIQGMLMPMIADSKVPDIPKAFCISILGALFKPYPDKMKVRCEITINQLVEMLEKNPSPILEEAIYVSLIRLSRHNLDRVIQTLLMWRPKKLSPNMEKILQEFVNEKTVKAWKAILRDISLVK